MKFINQAFQTETMKTETEPLRKIGSSTKMDNNEGGGGGGGEAESVLGSHWEELNRDCLLNIISRLTLNQRWTGPMLVCKSWSSACKDSSLHHVFDLETGFKSSSDLIWFWSVEFETKIDSMFRSVVDLSDGNLTEIRVRHCSDRALSYAAERCPKLEILSLKSCPNVTDASMTKIAFRCPLLKELVISYCNKISHQSLFVIGRNCKNLKTLKRCADAWQHGRVVRDQYLKAFPQDCDSEAAAIGKHMPNLNHLKLRLSKLSAKGLALLCEGCRDLVYLDLSGCTNLTNLEIVNATSNLKNLKELKKPIFSTPRSGFNLMIQPFDV